LPHDAEVAVRRVEVAAPVEGDAVRSGPVRQRRQEDRDGRVPAGAVDPPERGRGEAAGVERLPGADGQRADLFHREREATPGAVGLPTSIAPPVMRLT
jgi:hypothetical protein